MSVRHKASYGFDDYLRNERQAIDEKHEYVAGEVFAMTGASFEHNLITANLIRRIANQLDGKPCTVQANDMRVRVATTDAGTYPDVVVVCGPPRFYDDRRDTLTNPTLIIEVLSPSTEAYDRGGKFALYRSLPSLQLYALVAQDRLSVDLYSRQTDQRWLLTAYDQPDDHIPLEAIGCTLVMAEIYDKVELTAVGASGFAG
jgi:Uma2 family endonuclease